MYKPLQMGAAQTRNAKDPPLNHPSKYKPPPGGGGACTYKASPIDFETQISLRR